MKVGIIGDENSLKNVLLKNIPNTNIEFILDNKSNFFDILIVSNEMEINFQSIYCKYLLIDSDLNIEFINKIKNYIDAEYVLTYGSSQKATVTFSSILSNEKAEYQVCIQRGFKDIFENVVYPQEFSVECINKKINSNGVLLLSAVQLLMGSNIKKII